MQHYSSRPFRRHIPSPVGPHPLDDLLTEARRDRYRQVLARRCTSLAVVLEDCWDPHNATAVIRTCEAFGLHAVHIVTGGSSFRINRRVSQGGHLYTDIHLYGGIEAAFAVLRSRNFRIFVSDLAADAVTDPHELPWPEEPTALVFGNEEKGLSPRALELADRRFFIPMGGFTQSLNLSVSVAVSLYSLRHADLAADRPGDMSPEEQIYWYDLWVRRHETRKKSPSVTREPDDAGTTDPPKDPRSILETGRRNEPVERFDAPE